MGYTNLYQRRPPGASCNWVKEELAAGAPYRWWRYSEPGPCVSRYLNIRQSTLDSVYCVLQLPSLAWASDTLAGSTPSGLCGLGFTADGYVKTWDTQASPNIDVWGALKDGVWTSSVSFNVYWATAATATRSMVASPNGASLATPTVTSSTYTVIGGTTACTAGTLKVVTVYDDGRITIT